MKDGQSVADGPRREMLPQSGLGEKVFHQCGFTAARFSRNPVDAGSGAEPLGEIVPRHLTAVRRIESPAERLEVCFIDIMSTFVNRSEPERVQDEAAAFLIDHHLSSMLLIR